MNVLELLRSKGMETKKAGSTHGGEWCGPCPGCGGDDRFRVWPEQNGGKGSFWCRGCGKAGDGITFLMEFEGKTYPEVCRALDVEMEDREYRTPVPKKSQITNPKLQINSKSQIQNTKQNPPDLWVEQAGKLVLWANQKLLENDEQLAWLNDRGIDRNTVEEFRLGRNPGKDGRDLWRPRESWGLPTVMKENKNGKMVRKRLWIPRGLVVPLLEVGGQRSEVRRIRIRRREGDPRYYVLPGSCMEMMVIGDESRAFLVVESELDGIMCHVRTRDLCSVVALGSSAAKPGEKLMENLRNSAVILLGQDYDAAGAKAMAWWKREFHQAKTWPVPVGADPGEAFQAGTDIRAWISAGLPAGWRVGGSLLDNKKKAGDVEPEVVEKIEVGDQRSDVGDCRAGFPACQLGIEELAELLRKHPVVIHNTAERTFIAAPLKWQAQNQGIYKRISELVFLNTDVFRFISAHPAAQITGKNIKP
jgi:hypothetical protein